MAEEADFENYLRLAPQASREALDKLKLYAARLVEWNEKFNLVAPATIPVLWTRHFLDSAQLVPYLPKGRSTLADMGSGAGFPGLVLAVLTDHKIHLIESTGKKAQFLSAVAEELKLDVEVHNARIESLRLKADIVTARALKALPELLGYANHLIKKESICLFPKGQKLDEELTEAAKWWKFEAEKKPSLSDPSGTVLILRHLSQKEIRRGHGRK